MKESNKVRPKKNFVKIPRPVISKYMKELTHTEFKMLVALVGQSDIFGSPFFYSDEDLHERYGISRSSAQRARKKLRGLGLINYRSGFRMEGRARATTYQMYPNPDIRSLMAVDMIQKEPLYQRAKKNTYIRNK
jgi:predicted transcriptional regulator